MKKKTLKTKEPCFFLFQMKKTCFLFFFVKRKNHQPCTQNFFKQFRGNMVFLKSSKFTLELENYIFQNRLSQELSTCILTRSPQKNSLYTFF